MAAYAPITYQKSEASALFDIPFDYLSQQFIVVIVAGIVRTHGVDYDFLDKTRIRFLTGDIPAAARVTLKRNTNASSRLVSWKDASVLKANDLELSQLQLLHIAEEATYIAGSAILPDYEFNWNALGRRLTNLAEPQALHDGATKNYVDTSLTKTVRAPQGEVLKELPGASGRAGKILGFDSSGNPIAALPASGSGTELALALADPLNEVVAFAQPGDSVARFVRDKLLEGAVSILDYKKPSDGEDIHPAILRALFAIKSGLTKSRTLLIPQTPAYWECSSQVTFNLSDFTLLAYGNVKLTSNLRQNTFLFAFDDNSVPAQYLTNVTVLSNKSYVDGNAPAMTFDYAHADGSDNHCAIRFNRVKNLVARDWHGTHGPIDSFSVRECPNHYIKRCEFSFAREDNGFSATTDMPTWVNGDWTTFGYGVVEDCIAHHNNDFGMTAFNCSGVRFIRGLSYKNRGGYSYEDSYGSPDIKTFHGGFYSCVTYDCIEQGYYLNADGVGTDIWCRSRNIRGYPGDNSNNIYENGVVVASNRRVFIGGDHRGNGRCGLAIFNGSGLFMDITVDGQFNDNDSSGIWARGVGQLILKPGTEINRNGKVLVNGQFSPGLRAFNNGGIFYLQGQGLLKAIGVICSDNGLNGMDINYVKTVEVFATTGENNCQCDTGRGIRISNATDAKLGLNAFPSDTGNQTFAFSFESSVINGYDIANTGTGTVGVVANNSSTKQQAVRGQFAGSTTYNPPVISPGSRVAVTIEVIGADVGDFVEVSFAADTGYAVISGKVFTLNNVTVFINNFTGSPIDIESGTVRVLVTKRNGG
jgi:hypothetical protein